MKQIFMIIALMTSLGLSAQNNTIRVQGRGEVELIPDLMKFNMNFNINADSQESSLEELNELMDRVIADLNKVGIQEDSIKTDNFRTNVVDNTYRDGKSYFSSSQQMHFIIGAESDQIVGILNVLSEVEGDFNFSPQPMISGSLRKKKEKELAAIAFKNAQEQAEILGLAGGFELGNIHTVDFKNDTAPVIMRNFEEDGEAVYAYGKQKNFGNYNLAARKLNKSIWVTFYIEQ
jgi:uncharacterized protein YggE